MSASSSERVVGQWMRRYAVTTDKGHVYLVSAMSVQNAIFIVQTKRPGAVVSAVVEAEEL